MFCNTDEEIERIFDACYLYPMPMKISKLAYGYKFSLEEKRKIFNLKEGEVFEIPVKFLEPYKDGRHKSITIHLVGSGNKGIVVYKSISLTSKAETGEKIQILDKVIACGELRSYTTLEPYTNGLEENRINREFSQITISSKKIPLAKYAYDYEFSLDEKKKILNLKDGEKFIIPTDFVEPLQNGLYRLDTVMIVGGPYGSIGSVKYSTYTRDKKEYENAIMISKDFDTPYDEKPGDEQVRQSDLYKNTQ